MARKLIRKNSCNDRFEGIGLAKPHIYWDALYGEWLRANAGAYDTDDKALEWCLYQDHRWTPRDKP